MRSNDVSNNQWYNFLGEYWKSNYIMIILLGNAVGIPAVNNNMEEWFVETV